LSAQRIYQDLRAEQAFGGAYDAVKRFVRQLLKNSQLPVRRFALANERAETTGCV